MTDKVVIRCLPTGVPGLDALLTGGLAEYSFNLIAGAPGSGKTTLAHQIMFSLANPQCRAIFFTVLGEPLLKMLRYQQQYSFFDPAKVNGSIRFINLAEELVAGDYDPVLALIVDEIERFQPALVMVDSFRSVIHSARGKCFWLEPSCRASAFRNRHWHSATRVMQRPLQSCSGGTYRPSSPQACARPAAAV